MSHISFKIPNSEKEFLQWYSEKMAQPIGITYRNATLSVFQEWKIEILLEHYKKGEIGFKQLCRLSGESFQSISLLLQERLIEPPISSIMDEYTSKVRESIEIKDIFKDGLVPKRNSVIKDEFHSQGNE